jgi:hypothetical protein
MSSRLETHTSPAAWLPENGQLPDSGNPTSFRFPLSCRVSRPGGGKGVRGLSRFVPKKCCGNELTIPKSNLYSRSPDCAECPEDAHETIHVSIGPRLPGQLRRTRSIREGANYHAYHALFGHFARTLALGKASAASGVQRKAEKPPARGISSHSSHFLAISRA